MSRSEKTRSRVTKLPWNAMKLAVNVQRAGQRLAARDDQRARERAERHLIDRQAKRLEELGVALAQATRGTRARGEARSAAGSSFSPRRDALFAAALSALARLARSFSSSSARRVSSLSVNAANARLVVTTSISPLGNRHSPQRSTSVGSLSTVGRRLCDTPGSAAKIRSSANSSSISPRSSGRTSNCDDARRSTSPRRR
jgi:hypothetical protein